MSIRSTEQTDVQVTVDGSRIPGLLRASIATTNSFSADTFSLVFAMDPRPSGDMTFWSMLSAGCVTVTAATSPAYGTGHGDLITGMIDTVHINPIRGTVAVEGRDLSSSMIEAYRQQDFVNQTASEVVSVIALHHNLHPIVTPTNARVGRYYGDGYTKLSLGQFSCLQSDWDLLVQLARQHDFDVFVLGRSLYFQPATASAGAAVPISIREIQNIRIERNLNLASPATVKVHSWNSQNMSAYRSRDPRSDSEGSTDQVSGGQSPFLFSGANYTPHQVDDLARRYAAELGRLNTVLELDMPWDLSLSPRAVVLLSDTTSPLDTTYQIDSIERHYSSTHGSTQMLRAVQVIF
jgi:hypothetical protein